MKNIMNQLSILFSTVFLYLGGLLAVLIALLYVFGYVNEVQESDQRQQAKNFIERNQEWLWENSSYSTKVNARLVFLKKFNIARILNPTLTKERFEEGVGRAVALYNTMTNTIILPKDWNFRNEYHQSMLLHEMVHAMQTNENASFPCERTIEKEAYNLQIKWLHDRYELSRKEAMKLMNIDGLTLFFVTKCMSR